MSTRKRTWTSPNGEKKFAWQADYVDQAGKRHRETFRTKGEAEAFLLKAGHEVSAGIHTASSTSKTIGETGKLWLDHCEGEGLERATIGAYRQHLNLHIVPFIGAVKLSAFTAPMVSIFQKQLRDAGRSNAMIRKARVALGALLNYGTVHGLVAQNVVYSLGRNKTVSSRTTTRLEVGVDIPSCDEIRAIHASLQPGDRYRALLTTAFFTGLRASELRGLRWVDVDLKRGELAVRQRADRFNKIGAPKSKAGARTVPLMPMVVSVLREHKLATPTNELDLVFPNSRGHIDHLNTIVSGWCAAQIAARVVDKDGNAKYSGLHSIRHFFASWCINRKADGGLELPAKTVQVRCGHATIGITLDVYGHLFPSSDHGAEMIEAQSAWQR